MASTRSTSLWSVPRGDFTYVTLEGHGDMKMIPILSLGSPVSFMAFSAARIAATSTGGLSGRRFGIRFGNRTRISRTTEGHAVLMAGSRSGFSLKYSLVASETSSAAALTSKTS